MDTSSISAVEVYGKNSQYSQLPTPTQYTTGVVPLDALPAQWWNALWGQVTADINKVIFHANSVSSELRNLFIDAGIEPSASSFTQLKESVEQLVQRLATGSVAGAIKSSSTSGKILVDSETGIGSVNDLGDPSQLGDTYESKNIVSALNYLAQVIGDPSALTTTSKVLVNAINEAAQTGGGGGDASMKSYKTGVLGYETVFTWEQLGIAYTEAKTFGAVGHLYEYRPEYLPVGVSVQEDGIHVFVRHTDLEGNVVNGTDHKLWGSDLWGQGVWDGWRTVYLLLQVFTQLTVIQ